jgi:hypothetical protein
MHQAEFRMHMVMVKMGAFAQFQVEMNFLGLVITSDRVGPARFHCGEERDQSRTDAILVGDLSSQVFLGDLTSIQILHRSTLFLSRLVGQSFETLGNALREALEMLDQNSAGGEVRFHGIRLIEQTKHPLKTEPIEPAQTTGNLIAKLAQKGLRYAVPNFFLAFCACGIPRIPRTCCTGSSLEKFANL